MNTQNYTRNTAKECALKIERAVKHREPFRHLVIDRFLPTAMADRCLEDFPHENTNIWDISNDDVEIKMRSKFDSEFDFPGELANVVRILNSSIILKAMAEAIGITKLIPDPYFTGGGLNLMTEGGALDVHIDGNYHDAMRLNRRLNAILFLNPKWKKHMGGEFGLYNKSGTILRKSIEPIMNRLVIFDTHDESYHGIPSPISFDRRSLILYYYTVEPRQHMVISEPHSALWRKKDFTDKKGNKTR
ncbi:2OG-Fe(II) oxygenase [Candidatus Saccharibacteria bacterium]|nr:2OG-Fe(II) oxygenase [Candidatus Saccharibacteria bacterium]